MMNEAKYEKLRDGFIKIMEDLVVFRGTEPIIARIFALVILSPKPLTQEEITEITGYSRSQISRYLANLEQRGMIKKESKPGSRTQLYGGGAQSFFENFRHTMDITESFVRNKVDTIEFILQEWSELPDEVKAGDEAKRLQEVIIVFEAWFKSYLDMLSDFNERFNARMKELERELFKL